MKKILFICLLTANTIAAFCQSTTISPDGVFIPRVNSLGTCASPSKGQMVYLNSDNKMYYCNGAAWQGPSEFFLPFFNTTASNSDLFKITNNGLGGSIYANISNSSNNDFAIYAQSDGTGAAGRFYNQNVSGHALQTVGKLNFSMPSMGHDKVLTSDASGNATWQAGPRHEVAFAAYGLVPIAPGYNEQAYPGSTYSKIRFQNESYDLGNDLNSSVFTAPYHGIYHFDLISKFVGISDLQGDWYNLSLWKDDTSENVAQLFAGHNYYGSIQLSTDVILAAGQTITAKFYTNATSQNGWLYTDDHLARFTGHIITRLD